MSIHKTSRDWRAGTKRRMIAELAERGMSKREAYATLKPLVLSQTEPMVFKANAPGGRIAKPVGTQLIELKNEIGRVWVELGKATDRDFDSEEITSEEMEISEDETTEDETTTEEEEEQEEDSTERCYTRSVKDELRYFLKRVKEIRRFCIDRKARYSQTLDNISMRPAQVAAKLIPAGIPADVLLLSMTMHWEPDIRGQAGIDSFDFNADGALKSHPEYLRISKWVMRSRGITEIIREDGTTETPHELFGFALILAENRAPIMFIGPAGTGKSHLARQLAAFLECDYAETPMSTGASRGDLLGRHTISQETPFINAEFSGIYGAGGIFNFEEIDRADPGVVITLNNALAGSVLYNSVNGEEIDRHEDFIPVATANTFGLGANREYTAAERLDAATLDRFRMGRIYVPIDESLEEKILFGSL